MAIDLNAIMAQAQLDPGYLAQHGANTAALKRAILGYGDSSALSPEEAALYGIQPGDVSAANTNQYGTVQQLQQQLAGDNHSLTQQAAGRGLEFSGANAAAHLHEQQDAGQRSYNAYQALQNQIAGIGQNDTNALTGSFTNLANQAAVDPTIPAPIPAAPNLTPPTGNPGVTYLPGGGNTGAGAPAASAGPREFIPTPIKPPKLPKLATGYQGHA